MNDAERWADDGGQMTNRLAGVLPPARGRRATGADVGDVERWASLVGGGMLAIYGLSRMAERDRSGLLFALMGGVLAWRGAAGHSHLYEGMQVSRFAGPGNDADGLNGEGIRVERSIVVQRPATELWRFWRNLENLPRFVEHLESVLPLGGNRFHWTVRAPIGTVSWDAEIIGEREGDYLAWRSLAGSEVPNEGWVRFVPKGGATEVHVSLAYEPPAGPLGAVFARMFGEEPHQQVRDDLERFKQAAESGEVDRAGRPGL